MPGSDEMFHGKKLAPSMFKNIRANMAPGDPTAEDMEQSYEGLLHNKHVNLKDVCVKIFDLTVQSDVEEYCKLYQELYAKVQSKDVVIRSIERKFVEQPTPRWLVYLEWWVYALEVDGKEVTPEELAAIKAKDSAISA